MAARGAAVSRCLESGSGSEWNHLSRRAVQLSVLSLFQTNTSAPMVFDIATQELSVNSAFFDRLRF